MKNRTLLWCLPILALGAAWFVFHSSGVQTPNPQAPVTIAAAGVNPAASAAVSNATPPPSPAVAPNTNVNMVVATATNLPPALTGERLTMHALLQQENQQSQDFYGKIIDQYGQPVPGVTVTGNLQFNQGLGGDDKMKIYTTQSDIGGLFQFTGITGARFGVVVKKDGYVMGEHAESFQKPAGGKTSFDDPAIIKLWKLRGPEHLVSVGFKSTLSYDGTPTTFDIATQKKNPNGDLQVTLTRSPLEIRRGRDKFNWNIKIELLSGGLLAENDPYPYWAPDNGYSPSLDFSMSTNTVPWNANFTQDFYIHSSHGQYGLMHVEIYTALTPVRVKFNFLVNPSGSQNLEPTPSN